MFWITYGLLKLNYFFGLYPNIVDYLRCRLFEAPCESLTYNTDGNWDLFIMGFFVIFGEFKGEPSGELKGEIRGEFVYVNG